MLLDPGRDGEDVRVEDHVLRRERRLRGDQVVRPAEDVDLPLHRVGLATLVERHHDDRRSEPADDTRLLEEDSSPSLSEIELTTPLP